MKRGVYLVAGLGAAGDSALKLLKDHDDPELLIAWESGGSPHAKEWARRGIEVFRSADGADALERVGPGATVIKSPGLPPDHALVRGAQERGLEVIDELELAWRTLDRPIAAVTGTNGKSTTSRLIGAAIGDGTWVGNTEIGSPASSAKGEGWLSVEVSSFQLQFAPTFLPQVAVFTNLTYDHIAWHGSLEDYFAVKSQMFVSDAGVCGHAIVNLDDPHGSGLEGDVLAAGGRATTFGFDPADIQILRTDFDARSARISLDVKGELVECESRLPGPHNALNFAGAVGAALAAGMDLDEIVAKLADVPPPPGRCEVVDEGQDFDVIVDYAHNGDGAEQIVGALAAVAHGRDAELRTVFGPVSAGERDKTEEIAAAVARHSDRITLTPGSMGTGYRVARLAEMRAVLDREDAEVFLNRAEAIEHTLLAAKAGDVVAILGHGTLGRLLIDAHQTELLHDDRAVARSVLARVAG